MLGDIPAREKVLFLDACHSGEIDKDESEVIETNNMGNGTVAARGFKKVSSTSISQRYSIFELMNQLFADLKQNNGTTVIASASGKEFAFEGSDWKNGVFTYALIDGLKNKRIEDENRNKQIDLSEMQDYLFQKVSELTKGKQHPTTRTINSRNDFGLVR